MLYYIYQMAVLPHLGCHPLKYYLHANSIMFLSSPYPKGPKKILAAVFPHLSYLFVFPTKAKHLQGRNQNLVCNAARSCCNRLKRAREVV